MSGILRGMEDEHTVEVIAEIYGRKSKFQATFKIRDWADASAASTEVSNFLNGDGSEAWKIMENIIRADLVRWSHLQGEGGEVDYSDDNLDKALTKLPYLRALYQGWNAAQMLQKGVNSKN